MVDIRDARIVLEVKSYATTSDLKKLDQVAKDTKDAHEYIEKKKVEVDQLTQNIKGSQEKTINLEGNIQTEMKVHHLMNMLRILFKQHMRCFGES